jgi:hypothetical protein
MFNQSIPNSVLVAILVLALEAFEVCRRRLRRALGFVREPQR